MQDAFGRDMFNLSDVTSSRYNGHVQFSSVPKVAGGKKDRKGCNKGKIEAIMKSNSIRPKLSNVSPHSKKPILSTGGVDSFMYINASVKSQLSEYDDPYTFSEPEPQTHTVQTGSSLISRKVPFTSVRSNNMVCQEKVKVDSNRIIIKSSKPSECSSKMNKLQADIARSKVMGKRRKIEQPSPNALQSSWELPCQKPKDNNKLCILSKRAPRKSTWQRERRARHELLQRIEQVQKEEENFKKDIYPLGLDISDSDDDSETAWEAVYERHWFSRSTECWDDGSSSRERRVQEMRGELRRRLGQTLKGIAVAECPSTEVVNAVIAAARVVPNGTAALLTNQPINKKKIARGANYLISGEMCSYSAGCNWQSLPCTRHCVQHIMYNVEQKLFSRCTAKFSDNTQCNVPVFDVLHDLPLCHEHAVDQDNINKNIIETKPAKKVNKKGRILGLTRSGKRSQKKKRKQTSTSMSASLGGGLATRPPLEPLTPPPPALAVPHNPLAMSRLSEADLNHAELVFAMNDLPNAPVKIEPAHPTISSVGPVQLDDEVTAGISEGVLAELSEEVATIATLDPVELANQASHLLEEHDLTNVLDHISPDTFNDLFTEDKNGEHYEPTMEEREELERALEAVDNDVRSLERMTRSLPPLLQIPLDAILLDDPSPAPPPPPYLPFQNGFPPTATTDIQPS